MIVNQAFRYELDPNNKQKGLMLKHAGVARFAWNWGLAQRIALFEKNEGKAKFTNFMKQHRRLNALKKVEFPWMYKVSKCAPQCALEDLDRAFANFWRGRRKGYSVGFPKFKKKGTHDSFRLRGCIRVFVNVVQLPRLGRIRIKGNTAKFSGHIFNATISREADRWFVSFAVERERAIPDNHSDSDKVVGIDLGINSFATVYDGVSIEHITAPKPLERKLKKLQRLCRCLSRKMEDSNNRQKSALHLAKLHRRIRNTRRDFLHKLSSSLAKTKSAICIEDLNVNGMMRNRRLARSIMDAGWGEFRRMLQYKTKWYGSQLAIIDHFAPTSKMCSECGAINENLVLNDRTWVCANCGAVHERDENSAKNVRRLGLEILNTGSSPEINACGVSVRPREIGAVHEEAGSKHANICGETCGTVNQFTSPK